MKLWSGRFSKETDEAVNDFNSSIHFDSRMFSEDIKGSIAHASMLGAVGIIDTAEAEKIVACLEVLLEDIKAGTVQFSSSAEDIHMNVETLLTQRLGETGKRLHTARSRNDQVALDFRMYTKNSIISIRTDIARFVDVLADLAEEHLHTIMPGYTHLQRAQPITLGHHLCAWSCMLLRDISRLSDCLKRMDEMPLGSGALAGTTFPIDRDAVRKDLGFARLTQNSLDAVADRDFAVELLSCLSLHMAHLSRMSEEIILWTTAEFGFAELDDAYSTGSSIMPQKKNPDVAELVRGKTGRVYGDLTALLTVIKGLPLAYNKDLQEDKEALFDAVDTVKLCLSVMPNMIKTLTFKPAVMRDAASKGFLNATDLADYLVRKSMPFREAYTVSGKLVRLCIETGYTLETLPLEVYQLHCELFTKDVYEAISLETCVNERKSIGGPSPERVLEQIAYIRREKTLLENIY